MCRSLRWGVEGVLLVLPLCVEIGRAREIDVG